VGAKKNGTAPDIWGQDVIFSRHPIGFLHNLRPDVCRQRLAPRTACFLLSPICGIHTRTVFPIPTPSSARRIGIGREGDDL
jgi:hypothetical protein